MLFISSTNLITLSALYDSVAATYVNDATVSAVLTNQAGTQIASVTLAYVTASNGNYQGQLAPGVTNTLTATTPYTLTVTAVGSNATLVLVEEEWAEYDY